VHEQDDGQLMLDVLERRRSPRRADDRCNPADHGGSPEHDTPEVMREYGPAHGLDPVNWMFLTSGPDRPGDTTRKLAERFGHTFTEAEDGYQVHGVVTHVIDREGQWQANFHGLKFKPTNLVVYVNALVNDAGRPHAHEPQSFWEAIRGWF
jgi:protein SCO1